MVLHCKLHGDYTVYCNVISIYSTIMYLFSAINGLSKSIRTHHNKTHVYTWYLRLNTPESTFRKENRMNVYPSTDSLTRVARRSLISLQERVLQIGRCQFFVLMDHARWGSAFAFPTVHTTLSENILDKVFYTHQPTFCLSPLIAFTRASVIRNHHVDHLHHRPPDQIHAGVPTPSTIAPAAACRPPTPALRDHHATPEASSPRCASTRAALPRPPHHMCVRLALPVNRRAEQPARPARRAAPPAALSCAAHPPACPHAGGKADGTPARHHRACRSGLLACLPFQRPPIPLAALTLPHLVCRSRRSPACHALARHSEFLHRFVVLPSQYGPYDHGRRHLAALVCLCCPVCVQIAGGLFGIRTHQNVLPGAGTRLVDRSPAL